jgi:hypothetical protein
MTDTQSAVQTRDIHPINRLCKSSISICIYIGVSERVCIKCVRLSNKGNQRYKNEIKKEENGLNTNKNAERRERSAEQAAVEQCEH